MKKLYMHVLLVLIVCKFFTINKVIACGTDFPTEITGPPIIDYNNIYRYTMTMSEGYKTSPFSGQYIDTEWSINGIGIVGYGEIFNLSTTGWGYPEGNYVLTGKNKFANQNCYGCVTNSVFTKSITLKRLRPDLLVEVRDWSSILLENKKINVKIRVSNNGDGASGATQVNLYWSKNCLGSLETAGSISIGAISPLGTADFVKEITTPTIVNASESYCLIVWVDGTNNVFESNENNNQASVSATIEKPVSSRSEYTPNEQKDLVLDNLISVVDLSGNVYWTKEMGTFTFSSLKDGLFIFRYKERNHEKTQMIFKGSK